MPGPSVPFSGYCRLRGQLVITVADTTDDVDLNPDGLFTQGTILLTPSVAGGFLKFPLAGQGVVPKPIMLTLDAESHITVNGSREVYIPPTNDPDSSPLDWTWTATFVVAGPDGIPLNIPSYSFSAPMNGDINLFSVAPVASGGGTLTVQGPQGDTGFSQFLVETEDGYPSKPEALGEVPFVFIGTTNPDDLGLMEIGDTWVNTGGDDFIEQLYPYLDVNGDIKEENIPARLSEASLDADYAAKSVQTMVESGRLTEASLDTDYAAKSVQTMVESGRLTEASLDADYAAKTVQTTVETGRLSETALTASFGSLVPVSRFGVVGDGATDDTTALHNALASGEKLFIPPGFNVAFDGPLVTHVGDMIVGAGFTASTLTYNGSAGTWAIEHDVDTDDQWPGRVVLADFNLLGDGTGSAGAGATVNGIRCADDVAGLRNVPFYSVHRVRAQKLLTAFQLEGYGHHFQETHARLCGTGFDLTHPEQAMLLNCWAEYCDIGVSVNVRKGGTYGHDFKVLGGSYQRNRVGMVLQNLYEPQVDTYFELNTEADVILGSSSDPTDYTKGVKNARIGSVFSGSAPSTANVDAYATTFSKITFNNTSGTAMTAPHVRTNGYCKNIEVEYGESSINTSGTPFDFQGNSALTSWAHPRSGRESLTPTLSGTLVGVTSSSTSPLRYYKTAADEVVLEGAWDVGASYSGGPTILTLPTGFRPLYQRTFVVPMYTGSWGTAVVQINTNGTVQWQSGSGVSRTVFLGGLRFRTGQTAY